MKRADVGVGLLRAFLEHAGDGVMPAVARAVCEMIQEREAFFERAQRVQSTNEELQTINEELRDRSNDLNRANSFLESILTGVRSGVVVLDRELHVIAWNHRAEDLWGLRADEVRGQNDGGADGGQPAALGH